MWRIWWDRKKENNGKMKVVKDSSFSFAKRFLSSFREEMNPSSFDSLSSGMESTFNQKKSLMRNIPLESSIKNEDKQSLSFNINIPFIDIRSALHSLLNPSLLLSGNEGYTSPSSIPFVHFSTSSNSQSHSHHTPTLTHSPPHVGSSLVNSSGNQLISIEDKWRLLQENEGSLESCTTESNLIELEEDPLGILKYGIPGTTNIRFYEGFVASFDYRTRNACWTCQLLKMDPDSDQKEKSASREHSTFKEDTSIPEMFRSKLSDYRGSGFDRGHLVPAADLNFYSQKAMDDTFYLTNISPQTPQFNREYWARFEHFVRKLTKQGHSEVYVCTGPLYLPSKESDGKWYSKVQLIGNPPLVSVPTHYYKVILTSKPNQSDPSKKDFSQSFVL
eukprot:TRINITY_DN767_c0_g1_i2.p1 TRINITY_DN767_c0_g1~~TRINITY_DN767_c0_g1_i2.p1  ORF type:complete len:389 (-),score=159.76 TRINITY_DN767_c0_g1_i2:123-1289(-)